MPSTILQTTTELNKLKELIDKHVYYDTIKIKHHSFFNYSNGIRFYLVNFFSTIGNKNYKKSIILVEQEFNKVEVDFMLLFLDNTSLTIGHKKNISCVHRRKGNTGIYWLYYNDFHSKITQVNKEPDYDYFIKLFDELKSNLLKGLDKNLVV